MASYAERYAKTSYAERSLERGGATSRQQEALGLLLSDVTIHQELCHFLEEEVQSVPLVTPISVLVQRLLRKLDGRITALSQEEAIAQADLDVALVGLQEVISQKLFSTAHECCALECRKEDDRLYDRLRLFQGRGWREVGAPMDLTTHPQWPHVVDHLHSMCKKCKPEEKFRCLTNTFGGLYSILNRGLPKHAHGADDLLPSFILLVLEAQPRRIHASLRFLELFLKECGDTTNLPQVDYYQTTLRMAVHYWLESDAPGSESPDPPQNGAHQGVT